MLWVTSVIAAFGYSKFKTRLIRQRQPEFLPDASWRVLAEAGPMRVRFMGVCEAGYEVSAPMALDAHVALRPGDSVYVEAPGKNAAVLFKSYVIGRNAERHTLIIQPTTDFKVRNRRDEPRAKWEDGLSARMNGESAVVINLSSSGAKVKTRAEVSAGDWVKVDLPDRPQEFACVLEVLPDSMDGIAASSVRLVFAEPQ